MSGHRFLKPIMALIGGNIAGKLLGIFRELLQSALWGTSLVISSYRIAQTAVLIPINFFTAEALTAGFIPLLKSLRSEDEHQARALEFGVFLLVMSFAIFLTVVLLGKSNFFVRLLAPGFNNEGIAQTHLFVHIMAVSVPFYIGGTYFSCREMADERFFLPSIRASVQSIGLILGLATAWFLSNPAFIAVGFVGAYIIFFLLGWYRALYDGWCIENIKILAENKNIFLRFWNNIRPLLLLPLFLQGSIGIEKAVASLIGGGSVAALEYAKFITESGLYMIAVPLGLVGLSMLGDYPEDKLPSWVGDKIILILLICIPISFALYGFGEIIIRLCYQRGVFDKNATVITASILKYLGIGFWAQVGGYFLMKVLNARMRNREFILIMLCGLILQSAFNYFGYSYWGTKILGLSVSIYGVATFTAGSVVLGLSRNVFMVLAYLILGGIGGNFLLNYFSGRGAVLWLQILCYGSFWSVWMIAASPVRRECVKYLLRLNQFVKR